MSDDNVTKKTWLALIALGALGGILLAPMSGRETRQLIEKKINDSVRYLTSFGRDTRHEESGRRSHER
jgi:gas vesicle protein